MKRANLVVSSLLALMVLASPAYAVAVVDYASLVTAAMVEVTAAVLAGVTLFAAIFGIRVGIRILKKFAS